MQNHFISDGFWVTSWQKPIPFISVGSDLQLNMAIFFGNIILLATAEGEIYIVGSFRNWIRFLALGIISWRRRFRKRWGFLRNLGSILSFDNFILSMERTQLDNQISINYHFNRIHCIESLLRIFKMDLFNPVIIAFYYGNVLHDRKNVKELIY